MKISKIIPNIFQKSFIFEFCESSMLQGKKFKSIHSKTEKEALEKFRKIYPQAIILNIR